MFQHTAARRRLVRVKREGYPPYSVSTHSRPKAAGGSDCVVVPLGGSFNTQPPEGGWVGTASTGRPSVTVSTHSRPKAAGWLNRRGRWWRWSFQHTAARRRLALISDNPSSLCQFQHTAARRRLVKNLHLLIFAFCFNTQPPEGGWVILTADIDLTIQFQHTAARRRLASLLSSPLDTVHVSTHSRPKAAGCNAIGWARWWECFNTQPPEGGWANNISGSGRFAGFNTQPPEGGWPGCRFGDARICCFNTQPPEGGWNIKASSPRISPSFNTQPPEGGWFIATT